MLHPVQDITIRLSDDSDFDSIFNIWLEGIENSFDMGEFGEAEVRQKFHANFRERQGIFNFWVAVDTENKVVGWQSLVKFSNNPFRQDTYAESSTYIARATRLKGLGRTLLSHALQEAEASTLEYIIAFIAQKNEAARKMARETGWLEVGEIPADRERMKHKHPKVFLVRQVG